MRKVHLAWLAGLLMAGAATGSETQPPPAAENSSILRGTVLETMDASTYTYLLVDTGEEQIWAVTNRFTVEAGDTVSMPRGTPMGDFYSKSLDRRFEIIHFVSFVAVGGAEQEAAGLPGGVHPESPEVADVDLSGIDKAEGGKTVAEIFEGKAELEGQEIKVRGKVVKFTSGVMGKNWIHLRDGTAGADGVYDLVVTSDAATEVGKTVLVTGTVASDRDFGFGYKYDLMLENARVEAE